MREPRIDVMHRYVEEYTNRHDLSIAREIMHPDYQFTMGDTTLDLESYLAMVEDALVHFTDLRLVVDEFIVGPERLAMMFTETATSPKDGAAAAWRGAALYTFHPDGRLLAVTVQQDFWGRRQQYKGLQPTVGAGATDPAVWATVAGDDVPAVRAAIADALADIRSADIDYDDGAELAVAPDRVEVSDIVVSNRRFAAAVAITGPSRPGADDVLLTAVGAGTLTADGEISAGRFVTDRWGLSSRLRAVGKNL